MIEIGFTRFILRLRDYIYLVNNIIAHKVERHDVGLKNLKGLMNIGT